MTAQKPRVNKTKDEIKAELEHHQKVEKQKDLAKRIFPLLSKQTNIYDAQTVVNALAGYIKYELELKQREIKLNSLLIDLSVEKKNLITEAMEAMKVEFQDESANDLASLLERFGQTLSQYSSAQYMKNPMSSIKIEDLIA